MRPPFLPPLQRKVECSSDAEPGGGVSRWDTAPLWPQFCHLYSGTEDPLGDSGSGRGQNSARSSLSRIEHGPDPPWR